MMHDPPRPPPLPLLPAIALATLSLAACASPPAATTPPEASLAASPSDLPPVPICRDEMLAFVELTRLAKLHGEGWTVFGPAVDALKQQILDCIDDNREQYRAL